MLVHPALTTVPNLARVLVIGGGDGGTVREVLSYKTVEQVVMVEIDRMVVDVCKQFLSMIGTAWDDPRLKLIFQDGIAYAKQTPEELFDVVIIDGSDPVGPAKGLFTEEFYRDCARHLAPHGVLVLQSESPILQREVFLEIETSLMRVFPHVHPYFGPVPLYASGTWSWTYASRTTSPGAFDEVRGAHAEARSKYYNRNIHRAAFAVPNNLKPYLGPSPY